jgi:hypothetical protein
MTNKKERFTPGPWEVHDNIGRKGEMGIVSDGAPCIIAIMGNQKAWPLKASANARLIAAAPEMLEALQYAEKLLGERGPAGCTFGISKVIAKALGE